MNAIRCIALLAVSLVGLSVNASAEQYRRSDWRHWNGRCPNVRHQVLQQESLVAVTMSDDGCRVTTGEWLDPYTGATFFNPRLLDIDHLVPLREAHRSGAAGWTRNKKQQYANDTDNPHHLVAVSASSNRAKGAQNPSTWRPPNTSHWCDYARAWIGVKLKWRLWLDGNEVTALVEMSSYCTAEVTR